MITVKFLLLFLLLHISMFNDAKARIFFQFYNSNFYIYIYMKFKIVFTCVIIELKERLYL